MLTIMVGKYMPQISGLNITCDATAAHSLCESVCNYFFLFEVVCYIQRAMIPALECDKRTSTFPIGRMNLWKLYEKQRDSMWVPAEIKLAQDTTHYNFNLAPAAQHALKRMLGFFSVGDALVCDNIVYRFWQEINIPEVRYFYALQAAMENIHAETYAILINEIIPNETEKMELFNSIETSSVIKAIAKFINKCIASDRPLQERLFIMSCVEGILFVGTFAFPFWLQEQGVMPGLVQANEFISRDEGLHTTEALTLIMEIPEPLLRASVEAIIHEAIALADMLADDMFPSASLPGINAELTKTYVRYVADNHLHRINQEPIFCAEIGLSFMERINIKNRTDFFIKSVTEYNKGNNNGVGDFEVAEDF